MQNNYLQMSFENFPNDYDIIEFQKRKILDTPLIMYSSSNRYYIGTVTYISELGYITCGECYQGDPECFYRDGMISYIKIKEGLIRS